MDVRRRRARSSSSFETTATTHTFTGLWIGTFYFTIEATNAAGTGPRSAPRTTAVVVDALPDAPWDVSTSVDGRGRDDGLDLG